MLEQTAYNLSGVDEDVHKRFFTKGADAESQLRHTLPFITSIGVYRVVLILLSIIG